MGKIIKRALSYVCVFIMVLTAFHVLASNASGEEIASDESDVAIFDHRFSRITVSDVAASSPVMTCDANGIMHLAWVDHAADAVRIAYKRSTDNGTSLGQDRYLTPTFVSVDHLIITTSSNGQAAICFDALLDGQEDRQVFLLLSDDGGVGWSQTYVVGRGHSPSVSFSELGPVIGLTASDGEGTSFISILLTTSGDQLVNSTGLFRLPFDDGVGEVVAESDLVHFVFAPSSPSGSIVYGSVNCTGSIVTTATVVRSSTGTVKELDLDLHNGSLAVLCSIQSDSGDSIELATPLSGPDHWVCGLLCRPDGNVSDLSFVPFQDHYIASFGLENDSNAVGVLELSYSGTILKNLTTLSTANATAASPSLAALPDGTASCVWQEEHWNGSELFLLNDVTFERPDLGRLLELVRSETVEGSDFIYVSGTPLEEDLQDLSETMDASNEAAVLDEVELMLDVLEASPQGPVVLDEEQMELHDMTVATLEAVQAEILDVDAIEPVSIDISQAYLHDVQARVVSDHESIVSWSSSLSASSGEVCCVGPNGTESTFRELSNGRYHEISIATQPNSSYTFICRSFIGDSYLEGQTYFLNSGLSIDGFAMVRNGTNASLSWLTSVPANCTLYLSNDSTSYALVPVISVDGTSHSASLLNLTLGTSYSVLVRAVLSTSDVCYAELQKTIVTGTYDAGSNNVTNSSSDQTWTVHATTSTTITISNIVLTITGAHTARVTWTTDKASTSVVQYGLSTSYLLSKSGNNGTSHTVDLTDLASFELYHFRVRSVLLTDPNDIAIGLDAVFRMTYLDDNRGLDAGNVIGSPMQIAGGKHCGTLLSSSDTSDFYYLSVSNGQKLTLLLQVPTGFNYNLVLYNPSNYQMGSSSNSGSTSETITLTANVSGLWKVAVTYVSGTGTGTYVLYANISGGYDVFSLDVGASGDSSSSRLPGLSVLASTGWSAPYTSGVTIRDAAANAVFQLSLNPGSYQMYTDHLICITYRSTAANTVQVYANGNWVNVTTLKASTSWATTSFVLRSSLLNDAVPDSQPGTNVQMRFAHAASVDHLSAMAYSFVSGFETGTPIHSPGVSLENGWTVNSLGLANGTTGATLLLCLPNRADISWGVHFVYFNSTEGMEVQQQTSSSVWKTLGKLTRWGQSANVNLESTLYDTDSGMYGYTIRIKLMAPMYNLSAVSISPSMLTTDVGAANDNSISYKLPGVSTYDNTEWSGFTTVDSRTTRYTIGTAANFYLNGAWSSKAYEITMTYKTASAGNVQQWNGAAYTNVATLTADSTWRNLTFITLPSKSFDYAAGGQINQLFQITSGTCYVDTFRACVDSDGDTFSDAKEQLRFDVLDPTLRSSTVTKSYTLPVPGLMKVSFTTTLSSGTRCTAKMDGSTIWQYASGSSFVSLSLSINVALTAGTHSLQLVLDLGTSGTVDEIRLCNRFALDPFSNDTDSDSLLDNVEASGSTSPCNADSDNDGLGDAEERYSQVWATDQFYQIKDNGGASDRVVVKLTLPTLSAPLTAVWLQLGVLHAIPSQLKVYVQRGTGALKLLWNRTSASALFTSWDLLSMSNPYVPGDFTTSATWTVYVEDWATGTAGRVEYLRIQADGTTNPQYTDTDNDGIIDGEEVDLGTDGWATNPRSTDSDSDGVSDNYEIAGTTLCASPTDPTRNDTDDDGCNDNLDRYLGDAMVKVNITDFKVKDPINDDSTPSCYFVIHYHNESIDFATKRFTATEDQLYHLNWDYDVDVPETATSVYIDFEAVADEAGGWPLYDDIQLDIDSDSTNLYGITWTISSTPFVGENEGSGSADDDAYIKVKLSKQIQTKARVIVINGTDGEGGDYGLYKVGTNNYRFNADQQVYMLQLYVNSSSAHFQKGMNTIILPRAIALECKLNYTLSHLGAMNNNDPLRGAEFYYTDSSQSVNSAHIVATISKTVTAAQAEWILTNLTKNSAGERIGNNVTISPNALFLLHLPNDVLSSVPSLIDNEGLGNMPDYLGITGILSDIGDFLFDSLVFVATGGLLFLLLHLAEIGLKKLANLIISAYNDVKNAVDEMAKALNQFVDWLLDAIMDIATQMLSPLISPIENMYNTYMLGVAGAIMKCKSVVQSMGHVTTSSKDSLSQALNGDLYWAIIALSIVVVAVILIITGMTNIFSFLLMMAISLVIGFIIENAFNIMSSVDEASGGSTKQDLKEIMEEEGSLFSNPSNLNSALLTCGLDMEEIDDPQTKNNAELGYTIISAVVAQWGSKITYGSLAITKWECAWGVISIIAGLLGILFGYLSVSGNYDPCVEFVFGFAGLEYSVESLIFGLGGMKGTIGVDRWVAFTGAVTSFVSLGLTVMALRESFNGG